MIKDQIDALLICDDVRIESNGKHIIIGVYTGYIVVATMPFSIQLGLWIEYIPKVLGSQTLFVKMSYTTGFNATGKIEMDVKELRPLALGLPPIVVSGTSDGDLIIEVSNDQTSWEEVKRKSIRKGTIGTAGRSFAPLPTS